MERIKKRILILICVNPFHPLYLCSHQPNPCSHQPVLFMNKTASLSPQPTQTALNPARVGAIDILRALTMVLMIFVNDLWSLTGIPAWLEHVSPGADGIGLADVVFPVFLFIVGMSLPLRHR